MVIIWVMLSVAQSVLTLATIIQFVIMLINSGEPNKRLGDFGTDLGIWMAKAARYQTGASEVKPWPWTELDCTREFRPARAPRRMRMAPVSARTQNGRRR